jgi:hypothetical protein
MNTTTNLSGSSMNIEFMSVVGQNPSTGVDRQQESREAQSLYPSTLQLARALRLKFVGRAT